MKLFEFLELIGALNESIHDKGILKAVFMAGSPGSGKTYALNRIKSGSIEPRIVNTDKFFEHFGNNPLFVDKSKYLTTKQLVLYLNSMLPLFIDGTSSNPNNLIRRKGLLESIGYDVAMVFIKTNVETAVARVSQRGRKVPEEFIRSAHEKTMNLIPYYKSNFKTYYEINNSVGMLTNAVILEAYRKVSGFFNSGIQSPIGKELIQKMTAAGELYLTPKIYDMSFLNNLVGVWYRK